MNLSKVASMSSDYKDVSQLDVQRYIGTTPIELSDSARQARGAAKAEPSTALPIAALLSERAPRDLEVREKTAVALGGLAGNNAHGAGFLEALRRAAKLPVLITCTSGQVFWVYHFLKGHDLLREFRERLRSAQPFGSLFDWNIWFKFAFNDWQDIRLSYRQFPFDLAMTVWRSWLTLVLQPHRYSCLRELCNVTPARSLISAFPAGTFEGIADTLNAEKRAGVIFNAYDFIEGYEYVYLNRRAQELTGKKPGEHNRKRPYVKYCEITPEAVRDALRLYEYGFSEGSTKLDGAYFREIILSEIPNKDRNHIDRIAVVRPLSDSWIGPPPLSWVEMKDMQTEVNFNGTYYGERERIRQINDLAEDPDLQGRFRHIALIELPINVQRGWADYLFEDENVFLCACSRGLAVAENL